MRDVIAENVWDEIRFILDLKYVGISLEIRGANPKVWIECKMEKETFNDLQSTKAKLATQKSTFDWL